MVDINRVSMFLDISETLNFSETAKRLHVSQPTVSKYIRDLEQELGVLLFDRSGVRTRLTDAGQSLLPWARKLVHQSHDLEDIAKSLQEDVSGLLRIACTTAAGKYVLPQIAARFRKRYPHVGVNILACTREDAIHRLLEADADLVVVSSEVGGKGLDCQYFFTDHILLIVPSAHRWAAVERIDPSDLLGEPLLLREPESGTRRVLLSELAAHDIDLDDLEVFLEVGSAEAIVAAVGAGVGISFVSRMAAAYALAFECVVEVPVVGLDLRRKICMARRSNPSSNRARDVFWNFIHDPMNKDLYGLAEL